MSAVFLDENDPLFRRDDTTIVDALAMAAAVRMCGGKRGGEPRRVLENEPLLGAYVRDEVLKLAGRLALSGAGPCVCASVARDIHKLMDVAANALREGYRAMLSDLLPSAAPDEGDSPPAQRENREDNEHAK